MNYTDTQLKQAFPKMLPECIFENGNLYIFDADFAGLGGHRQVRETELLHLCHQVELTLSWPEYSLFKIGLVGQLLRVESASWQQRVAALAEVKGIEI